MKIQPELVVSSSLMLTYSSTTQEMLFNMIMCLKKREMLQYRWGVIDKGLPESICADMVEFAATLANKTIEGEARKPLGTTPDCHIAEIYLKGQSSICKTLTI
jgi:hypothetical protein